MASGANIPMLSSTTQLVDSAAGPELERATVAAVGLAMYQGWGSGHKNPIRTPQLLPLLLSAQFKPDGWAARLLGRLLTTAEISYEAREADFGSFPEQRVQRQTLQDAAGSGHPCLSNPVWLEALLRSLVEQVPGPLTHLMLSSAPTAQQAYDSVFGTVGIMGYRLAGGVVSQGAGGSGAAAAAAGPQAAAPPAGASITRTPEGRVKVQFTAEEAVTEEGGQPQQITPQEALMLTMAQQLQQRSDPHPVQTQLLGNQLGQPLTPAAAVVRKVYTLLWALLTPDPHQAVKEFLAIQQVAGETTAAFIQRAIRLSAPILATHSLSRVVMLTIRGFSNGPLKDLLQKRTEARPVHEHSLPQLLTDAADLEEQLRDTRRMEAELQAEGLQSGGQGAGPSSGQGALTIKVARRMVLQDNAIRLGPTHPDALCARHPAGDHSNAGCKLQQRQPQQGQQQGLSAAAATLGGGLGASGAGAGLVPDLAAAVVNAMGMQYRPPQQAPAAPPLILNPCQICKHPQGHPAGQTCHFTHPPTADWMPYPGRVRRAGPEAEKRYGDAREAKGWRRFPMGYEPQFEKLQGPVARVGDGPAVNAAAVFMASPFDGDLEPQLLAGMGRTVDLRAAYMRIYADDAVLVVPSSASSHSSLPLLVSVGPDTPSLTFDPCSGPASDGEMPELGSASEFIDVVEVAAQQLPRSFRLLDVEDEYLSAADGASGSAHGAVPKAGEVPPKTTPPPAAGSARTARAQAAGPHGPVAAKPQAAGGPPPAAAEAQVAGPSGPAATCTQAAGPHGPVAAKPQAAGGPPPAAAEAQVAGPSGPAATCTQAAGPPSPVAATPAAEGSPSAAAGSGATEPLGSIAAEVPAEIALTGAPGHAMEGGMGDAAPSAGATWARAMIGLARSEGAPALVAKPLPAAAEPTYPRKRLMLCLPSAGATTPQVAAAASSSAAAGSRGLAASFFEDDASFAPQDFLRGPDASLALPDGQLVSIPWTLVDTGSEVSLLDQEFCDHHGIRYEEPVGLVMRTADTSLGQLVGVTERLTLQLAPGTGQEASLGLRCLVVKVQGMAYSALMGKGPLRALAAYANTRTDQLCYTAADGSRATLPLFQRRTLLSAALTRMFCVAATALESATAGPCSFPLWYCPEELSDCSSDAGEPADQGELWREGWLSSSGSEDLWGKKQAVPSLKGCLQRVAEAAHWKGASPAARAAMLPRLFAKARQMQVEAAAVDWWDRPTRLINLAPKVGLSRPLMLGSWATRAALDEMEDARTRAERMARRMARGGESAVGTPLDPGVLFLGCC